MKLPHLIAILGFFLLPLPGNAMELPEEGNSTVRIWKPTPKIPEGHASIGSDDYSHYYMGLRPAPHLKSDTRPRATFSQLSQDRRDFGNPDETYTFRLNLRAMNDLWQKLTYARDEPLVDIWGNQQVPLMKVRYPKKKLNITQEEFAKSELLYCNATTLVKGLLYTGGIKKIRGKIKYFKEAVELLEKENSLVCNDAIIYDDIITFNYDTTQITITIDEITQLVKKAVHYQILADVENNVIRPNTITYLRPHHKREICDRVLNKNQSYNEIAAHLQELHQKHAEYKQDYSRDGWVNYLYTWEWAD